MARPGRSAAGRLLPIALVALLGAACSEPETRPKPSFVIVSIDTLRRSSLRAFSSKAGALPALDALAERSARFLDASATSSWTLPSHASLLTGLYPDRHGATRPDRALSPKAFSLPEALQKAGYETVGLMGGGYLEVRFGFGRGFDRYQVHQPRGDVDAVFQPQIAVLAEARDRPLFLFAHTFRLHNYFHLRPETVAALGIGSSTLAPKSADPMKENGPAAATEAPKPAIDCLNGRQKCSEAEWELLEALYEQEMRFVDRRIGALLDALEAGGLADSTYVFVLSDHGEGFDPARGRLSHGGRLHEDVIRIPLLVAGPDVEPGDRELPVSLVDVAPTVLELAGLPARPDLDGRSLAPVLRGWGDPVGPRHLVALEHAFLWDEHGRQRVRAEDDSALGASVVRGRDWYIVGPGGEELYDMAADPEQRANLARSKPDVVKELRDLASERVTLKVAPRAAATAAEQLREQLEALGYAE